MVMRDQHGQWGNPVSLTLTGGNIGWQAGASEEPAERLAR
jgi:lipid-binding SYLF domain-containing protein